MRSSIVLVVLLTILSTFTSPAATYAQGDETLAAPAAPSAYPGDDLRFDHLGTEDGLSSNEVLCLLQDRHSFMWIGTFNGLNRYDGHTITVYRSDLDDPNSLSSNTIRDIHEDQQGILWIGTSNGGLNRFDPSTQTFAHYLNDPNDPNSLSDNTVMTIAEDSDGTLWLGTRSHGLDRFDPAAETFTHYPPDPEEPNSLGEGSVDKITIDRKGNLWAATFGGGLSRLDRNGQVTRFQHDPNDPNSLSSDKTRWVYEDSAGNIWVPAHDGGLDRLEQERADGQNARFVHYQHNPDDPHSINEGLISRIFQDSSGTLWVGGHNGLAALDPETDDGQPARFTRCVQDPTNPYSLSHNVITAMLDDQAGILWVGTFGGGVSIHTPATRWFARHQHDPDDPNSLGVGGIQAAYEDTDGVLWLGISEGGLDKFDPTTGRFTHYRHDPEDPNSLAGNNVRAIHEDNSGIFWVGTWNGLDQFDRENGQFRHMYDARIVTAYEDQSGIMWFGTVDDGLLRFNQEREQFEVFRPDPDDPNSLSDKAVSAMIEDHTGALWVGTWGNGLNRFDRDTGRFRVYRRDPNDPNTISNDRVEVLYEDQAGRLWIGTANGVSKFDRDSETFTHYTVKDGLPDNYVNGILEESAQDGQGVKLWLGTKKGLARFDPQTETFQNYNTSHGLQDNASDAGHFKGTSGEMIFGSESGFTVFYPDQIAIDPYIPPVVLTNFKLLNQTVPIGGDSPLQQAVWDTDHITLSYEDRVITFGFTALSYANPAANLLRYKLEGFDDEWSHAGTIRSATYTNLDPGDYVFRVRGSNSDGVWNEEGASLGITITPPWWQTTWFRGLMLLVVIAAIVGVHNWRGRSMRARNRELESLVVARTDELQMANQQLATEAAERRQAQEALQQRVEELNCLYGISGLAGQQDITVEEILVGSVELIPPSWQYPEIAEARIVLEGQEYKTDNFAETVWRQSAGIHVQGEPAGTVEVCYLEERPERDEGPFLKEERNLLNAVAGRLGRIVVRLRAEEALRQTRDELATLLDLSRDVASTLELEPLLSLILDQLKGVVDYDIATIRRLEQGVLERLAYRRFFPHEAVPNQRLVVANLDILREVIQTQRAVLVGDIRKDPGFFRGLEAGVYDRPGLVLQEARTLMAVPLLFKSQVIGVLVLAHRQPEHFDRRTMDLAQAFANQVAIALVNAELYEKAGEAATLEERTRLARELHDSATQALYSATLFSEAGKELAAAGDLESAQHYLSRVSEAVHQALKDLRLLIFQLRPPLLEKEGLVRALQQRLDAVEKRAGMDARLISDELPPLPDQVAEGLYRIAQEALNNVVKHAQTDAVSVTIRTDGESVTLEVVDGGQGFDPEAVRYGGGMGLVGMHERAAQLGGDLTIDSAPEQGTKVKVTVETSQ